MFRTLKNIAPYVTNLFSHAVIIGKNKNKDAVPFLTTIAAIIYVLSTTLGSGSYEEMYQGFGIIPRYVFMVVLIMAILMFGSCLLSYIFVNLNFKAIKTPAESRQTFLGKKSVFFLSATSACIAVAIALYSSLVDNISPLSGKPKFLIIYFFAVVPIVILFISFAEKVLSNISMAFIIFDAIIVFCIINISYNIYRDSYKNSLNSNSQFCFWTSNKFLSGPPEEINIIDTEDYNLCNNLRDANVEFEFFPRPYE